MECSRGCSGEIKGSSLAEIPASLPVPQKWGCWPFLPYGEVPNLGGTLGGHALDTAAALDVAAVWPPCPTWQMDKKRWQQAVPREGQAGHRQEFPYGKGVQAWKEVWNARPWGCPHSRGTRWG